MKYVTGYVCEGSIMFYDDDARAVTEACNLTLTKYSDKHCFCGWLQHNNYSYIFKLHKKGIEVIFHDFVRIQDAVKW